MSGGAYAAITIPANSVGTKQLKNGAVTASKIARGTAPAPTGYPAARVRVRTRASARSTAALAAAIPR